MDCQPTILLLDASAERKLGPEPACVNQMEQSLKNELSQQYTITRIAIDRLEKEIAEKRVRLEDVRAVVLPGGNAFDYVTAQWVSDLDTEVREGRQEARRGYHIIKELVQDKGISLICSCAGAVFACSDMAVLNQRGRKDVEDLPLFGEAPPLFFTKKVHVIRPGSVEVVGLLARVTDECEKRKSFVEMKAAHLHGPAWKSEPGDTVHAYYLTDKLPLWGDWAAIISRPLGKGTVFLMGVHPEWNVALTDSSDLPEAVNRELSSCVQDNRRLMRELLKEAKLELSTPVV